MKPKIEFRYSQVYDQRYRDNKQIQKKLKEKGLEYPKDTDIKEYIVKINKLWYQNQDVILAEIARIMGLKWKEKKIICYVIGAGRPFSDPLTISIQKNINDFIDILIHELIHQLQSQNREKWVKWSKICIERKFKNEPIKTKRHILLHAVHTKLILKLYGKQRLYHVKSLTTHKDYKKSWEIVQKIGFENIIKEFNVIK